MRKRSFSVLLGAFAALTLSLTAGAVGIGVAPSTLSINGLSIPLDDCVATGETSQACQGKATTETFSLEQFTFSFDPDPNVVLFFAIQNTQATTQTFTVTAAVPVAAVGPGLTLNGSIAGSLTDTAGDGATLGDATGAPLYAAIIDANPLRSLLDAPQSITTTTSQTIGPAAFGPEAFAGSAASFIAVQIQFTLSPGDLASFTSVFNVTAVPEPGTVMLLGSGIVGIAASRRRRSA